ncbi:hypothetical protein H2200_010760 [Cladophialophora chaetospira]|uniref:Uncharacterized protein n=1 Tax=Cladophialophora chaetospira TaxID=386627 RepID=A0AA38X0Q5_9EURO|nr:hypothetical protein H2200_010760 [Cladophialophora chaetospira]
MPRGCPEWGPKEQYSQAMFPKLFSPMLSSPTSGHTYLSEWEGMIHAYSNSKLSFHDKDKIIAMEGIVQQFQSLWKKKYCAGHWRDDLELQLLWDRADAASSAGPMPQELMAPSWSWLSINGKATSRTAAIIGRTRDDTKVLASVTDVSIQEDTSSSSSKKFRGYLDLRCFLNEIVYDSTNGTFETAISSIAKVRTYDNPRMDYSDSVHGRLFFILVCERKGTLRSSDDEVSCQLYGLIIELLDAGSGTHVRCASTLFLTYQKRDGPETQEYAQLLQAARHCFLVWTLMSIKAISFGSSKS